MATLEQRIQLLADKDEIRELTSRYCYAVVRQDGAALVDMFCDDGEFQLQQHTWRGKNQLRDLYVTRIGEVTPKPFIQNHVIEVDGDTATGNCAVEIRMVQDGKAVTACGHYDDTYRRVGGQWKFSRRQFNLYHWVPLAQGWGAEV